MSTEIKCTCPSGDGSLRWPCPAHQSSLAWTVDAMFSVQPFEASDIVFGHPRELFRLTPAGDVVVSEGVSTTDAALVFWDAVAQLRPAPTELDRARETPRRQSAVELLLSLGYVWRTDRWEAPQPAVAPDRIAIKMLVAAGFVSEDKANEALRIAHGFRGDLGQAAPAAVPVDGVSRQMIRNAIRSAYDAGYNDSHRSGDNASGYNGLATEQIHGEALATSLSIMAGAAAMLATHPQPAAADRGDA